MSDQKSSRRIQRQPLECDAVRTRIFHRISTTAPPLAANGAEMENRPHQRAHKRK